MTSAAFDLLCRMVRRALDAEEGVAGDPVPMGDVAARDLLAAVGRHRVPELLRGQADALGLTPEVVTVLDAMREASRQRQLLHALETVRAWQLLTDAGIDALVFKGIPLAVLTTGTPDARGAGDVDVLVRPGDTAATHRVLRAAGWQLHEAGRIEPEMWAWGYVVRWGRTLTYLGSGADVDLHWRLDTIPGAQPPTEDLMARSVEVPVGGVRIPTLCPADAFHHLAAHREGWIWLRTLVDLRRLARDPSVHDQELGTPALTSLAVARATVGLPAGVPASLHAALDTVPAAALVGAREQHLRPTSTWNGAGPLQDFRYGLASARRPRDLGHVAVGLVLPAHAALQVTATSAWTGVPTALGRRARRFTRR
ncbi:MULTISPECIES: nucleotidyltransferase family protein [unclassified Nocardioides]|uniref:nucleotidyltransferase family protein n=1 Tax=unclassified Nocardioides TaxID=2615069 RepID=UPI0007031EDF|nr:MULTISPECIES: nucleotidyltransferase family protein [unclassified Nocardioides]KRC51380.1 hypothetical protein ASE19_14895 [Nocardioides sp. Root79]KRC68989.1 hypothetical protein ASE20_15550 [Nocardioides sp. Root240]